MKTQQKKRGKMNIRISGKGYPVVLLHGYLESVEIWKSFTKILKKKYMLIVPDLPGHGSTGVIAENQTMELLADHLAQILSDEGLKKIMMVGHSLGGYVTLAFAERHEDMLDGFCLFHSHPFADTEDIRLNRKREIALINEGKKELIVNTNIPKAFAPEHAETFRKEIEYAQKIAQTTPEAGIVAMLRGMMSRPDRSRILFYNDLPALWILGERDQYIPFRKMRDSVPADAKLKIETLENSGHMGFIEEAERSAEILDRFISEELRPVP